MPRWTVRVTVAVSALGLLLTGCVRPGPAAVSERPAPAPAPAVPVPTDNPQAFHGLGKLAFMRGGKLWLLDGETDTLRSSDAEAWSMTWSADGAWLAFRQDERLMLVEVATGKVREMTGLPGPVDGFAWAPAGHRMAVSSAGAIWRVEEPAEPKLERLGTVQTPAGDLAWSPDGRRIAFVRTLPATDPTQRPSLLELLEVESGQILPWYRVDRAYIQLAGWWPDGGGLLLWVSHGWCNSCNADGMPLESLALRAEKPVELGVMLASRDWLSWRPGGNEILMVKGGSRFLPEGKGLALCAVTDGRCRDLPQPADAVSLDPSFSPDGSRIALVRAAGWKVDGSINAEKAAGWVNTRRLWIVGADGSEAHEVTAAGAGIYGPAWTRDGRHLLYIKEGALWVLDVEGERAQRVVSLGDSQTPVDLWYRSGWPYSVTWYRP